jgi:hypothetical protein
MERAQRNQLVALTISLGIAWLTLYFLDGPDPVQRVSFRVDDPSWVPIDYQQSPIIGDHFFGDLQLLLAWGSETNPYSLDLSATYLPIAHFPLKALSLFPIQFAFVVYLAVSLIVLYFAARLTVATFGTPQSRLSTISFLLFCLLTAPTLIDIDRGNVNTIAIGLTTLYFMFGFKNKLSIGLPLLLLAGSIKPYLLIFTICFINKNTIKTVIGFLVTYLGITLVLFSQISNSIFRGLNDWYIAFSKYGGAEGVHHMINSGSLVGSISRWAEVFHGQEGSSSFLVNNLLILRTLSGVYILLALAVWFMTFLPNWIRLGSALSIITVAQPGSAGYQWIWVGIVMIGVLYSTHNPHQRRLDKIGLISIQIISILVLVPTWIAPTLFSSKRYFPQYLVLSPFIVVLIGSLFVFGTRYKFNLFKELHEPS